MLYHESFFSIDRAKQKFGEVCGGTFVITLIITQWFAWLGMGRPQPLCNPAKIWMILLFSEPASWHLPEYSPDCQVSEEWGVISADSGSASGLRGCVVWVGPASQRVRSWVQSAGGSRQANIKHGLGIRQYGGIVDIWDSWACDFFIGNKDSLLSRMQSCGKE